MKEVSIIEGEHRPQTTMEYPNRYAQIPPNGKRCEFTGLGHSRLYQLLNGPARGEVRVVSLREGHAKRGTRLFHVGDMLRFLDKLAVNNQPR